MMRCEKLLIYYPNHFHTNIKIIQENFSQYIIYDHLKQLYHIVIPDMQYYGNNSGIYPQQNHYRQSNSPLDAMEHELNHAILAMPDNDSQERNERDKHQDIASSNNLLHVREEFDLPL
ncbi:hypothetical protein O181_127440 [Austropuccinia psidii MF-1]|uniref:Uncharacterized protein n=1 Tax=Austropuccinia psidii MF-1 TaxID=1389203 RepID=A0A9Q3KYG6_9BASI|nr:hypothetical protein [Austropuccinia psidii MF-1]